MKRSGSTLQYQLASFLIEQAGGIRIPWFPSSEFPAVCRQYAEVSSWKVFKSHDCTPEIASEINHFGALGLYIYRDLRDVIGSQMQMSKVSFEQLWSIGFLDECVDNCMRWKNLPRVSAIKYEDIVNDLPRLLHHIADHLNIVVSHEDCARIISDYTIASQKKRIEAFTQNQSLQRVEAVGSDLLFDPHSLLHFNHINTGVAGAWKQLLTPEQSALVESKFGDWLRSFGYL